MNERIRFTSLDEIKDRLRLKTNSQHPLHNSFGLSVYAYDMGYINESALMADLRGKRILDVSAGFAVFGRQINSLSKREKAGTWVVSVEPTAVHRRELVVREPHLVNRGEIAAELADRENNNLVSSWTDEGLPFSSGSFDVTVDHNGFLLWYDLDSPFFTKAYTEMKRVTNRKGKIITCMAGGTQKLNNDYINFFQQLGFHVTPIFDKYDPKDPLINGFILT